MSCRVVPFLASFWTNNVQEACPLRHPKQFSDDKKLSGVSLHRRNVLSTWNRNQWKYYLGSWGKRFKFVQAILRQLRYITLVQEPVIHWTGQSIILQYCWAMGAGEGQNRGSTWRMLFTPWRTSCIQLTPRFWIPLPQLFEQDVKLDTSQRGGHGISLHVRTEKKINRCIRMYFNLMYL